MPVVHRSGDAVDDLRQIARFIASDDPEAANRWLNEIDALCRLLSLHPETGEQFRSLRFGKVRRRALGAYVLYYRTLDDGIELLRIVHSARDHRKIL